MPFKFKRICPICGKPELKNISSHLEQVHDIDGKQRKKWLSLSKYDAIKHIDSTLENILMNVKTSKSVEGNVLKNAQTTKAMMAANDLCNTMKSVSMKAKHGKLKKQLLSTKPTKKNKNRSKHKVPLLKLYK